MKFYVIEITEGDSKVAGKAIYEYETETEAIASFHKKLGTAMSSDLYTSELVMVTDSYGSQIKKERYVVVVEETASEETASSEA